MSVLPSFRADNGGGSSRKEALAHLLEQPFLFIGIGIDLRDHGPERRTRLDLLESMTRFQPHHGFPQAVQIALFDGAEQFVIGSVDQLAQRAFDPCVARLPQLADLHSFDQSGG